MSIALRPGIAVWGIWRRPRQGRAADELFWHPRDDGERRVGECATADAMANDADGEAGDADVVDDPSRWEFAAAAPAIDDDGEKITRSRQPNRQPWTYPD